MFTRSNQRSLAIALALVAVGGCYLDPMDMRPGQGVEAEKNPIPVDLRRSVKTAKFADVPKMFNTTKVILSGNVFDSGRPYLDAYKLGYAGVPDSFLTVSYHTADGTRIVGKARVLNGVYGSVFMGPVMHVEIDGKKRIVQQVVGVTGMRTPPETLVAAASGEFGGRPARLDPDDVFRSKIYSAYAYVESATGASDEAKNPGKKKEETAQPSGEKPKDPNNPEAADIVDDVLKEFDEKNKKENLDAVILYYGNAFSGSEKGFFAYKLDLKDFSGKGYIRGITSVAGFRLDPMVPEDDVPENRLIEEKWRTFIVLDGTDNVAALTTEPYFPKSDPEHHKNIPSVMNKLFPDGNPLFGVAGRAYAKVSRGDTRGNTIWEGAYQLGIFGPNMEEVFGVVYADVPKLKTKDDFVRIPVIGVGGYRVDHKKLRKAYMPPSAVHPELLPKIEMKGGKGGSGGSGS